MFIELLRCFYEFNYNKMCIFVNKKFVLLTKAMRLFKILDCDFKYNYEKKSW